MSTNKIDLEFISQKIEKDKLIPSVDRLSRDEHDDHDIIPAIIWTLLSEMKEIRAQLKEEKQELSRCKEALITFFSEKSEAIGSDLAEKIAQTSKDNHSRFGLLYQKIKEGHKEIANELGKPANAFFAKSQREYKRFYIISCAQIVLLAMNLAIAVLIVIKVFK